MNECIFEEICRKYEEIYRSNFIVDKWETGENNALETEKYKVGVLFTVEFEQINSFLDEIYKNKEFTTNFLEFYVKFKITRNLLLEEAEVCEFTAEEIGLLSDETKFMWFLCTNQFEKFNNLLNIENIFNFEIIGADAFTSTNAQHTIEVVAYSNNTQMKEYFDKEYQRVEHKIPKNLSKSEALLFYAKIKEILHVEENELLKKNKVNAICRFMLNYTEIDILPFYVEYAMLNEEALYDLEKNIFEGKMKIVDVVKSDAVLAAGVVLMKHFEWEEAYEKYFRFYFFRNERIKCLTKAGNKQQLEVEIVEYIAKILKDENIVDVCINLQTLTQIDYKQFQIKNRILLGNLVLKLGHLFQHPTFYDVSFGIYNDFKPLRAKSMYFYTHKQFEMCAKTCEQLLEMNSELVDVNFNYGCCLMEMKQFAQAAKIFKKLRDHDQMNINVAKNLSHCYYQLNEMDEALKSLKNVAKSDQAAMKNYFLLSLKNNLFDNVKWALRHIKMDETIVEAINYIVYNNLITKEEIEVILNNNPHYDKKNG